MGFFDKINNNTIVDTLKQLRNRSNLLLSPEWVAGQPQLTTNGLVLLSFNNNNNNIDICIAP